MKTITQAQLRLLKELAVPGLSAAGPKLVTAMRAAVDTIERQRSQLQTLEDALSAATRVDGRRADELAALKAELDDAREDVLDQLNDRAEVVGELTKRVGELTERSVPKGWDIVAITKYFQGKYALSVMRVVGHKPEETRWHWTAKNSEHGHAKTLDAAVQAAEAQMKTKKAKR